MSEKARAVGINHVALEVSDIEEALAFYGRFLEFDLRSKSEARPTSTRSDLDLLKLVQRRLVVASVVELGRAGGGVGGHGGGFFEDAAVLQIGGDA